MGMKYEILGVSVFLSNSNIEFFSNLSFSDTRFVISIIYWFLLIYAVLSIPNRANTFVNTVVNGSVSHYSRNEDFRSSLRYTTHAEEHVHYMGCFCVEF